MQCAFNYIHGHSAVIAFSLDTAVRRDRAVEVQGPGPWSRSPQSARVGRPGRPTRVPHAREALRYSVVGPNSGRHQHAAEAAKPVAGGGWVPVGAYYRRDTRAGGEFAPTGDSALVGAWLPVVWEPWWLPVRWRRGQGCDWALEESGRSAMASSAV